MITGTFTLTEIVCCKCSTHFAIDKDFNNRCLATGESFYCPHGHSQSYVETEIIKLRKEKQRLVSELSWAENEAHIAKNERKAARAKLTRTQNRIANGVCPCCHRTFKQLAAHISTKHPDFKKVVT